jgi:hypothetical protein
MKKLILVLAFLGALHFQTEAAVTNPYMIIETNDPQDVLSYVGEGALVIFDIYNTLFETTHQLGSEQWADWHVSTLIAQGVTAQEARRVIVPRWSEILRVAKMRPVDFAMQSLVRTLQRRQIRVMGMTSKESEMREVILQQLQNVNVSLLCAQWLQKDLTIASEGHALRYEGGVLFCGLQHPLGMALLKFFDTTKDYPLQVIFISQKWEQINEMAQHVRARGLPYVGIRYGGADKRAVMFNPAVAEMQMRCFNKILCDEAALILLPRKSLLDFFDHFWD